MYVLYPIITPGFLTCLFMTAPSASQPKNTSHTPSRATPFYIDLCYSNIPIPSALGYSQPNQLRSIARDSASPLSDSYNEQLSIDATCEKPYVYDCTRCHRTFASSRRAEEHVLRENCGGIVGELVRSTFPCPCNAFRSDSEAGLRKHKQHCQGYGEWSAGMNGRRQ